MKSCRWIGFVCLCLALSSISLSACNSSSNDDDNDSDNNSSAASTNVHVDGVFSGKRENANGQASVAFNFNQSGSMLTGSYTDSSLGNGVVSGHIEGDDVEFSTVMSSGGIVVEWVGQATADGAHLSGTWNIVVGGSANGSWTAAR
ncbi:MAG: hypothetical protein M9963_11085 [Kiritimatiellae bacterium]|nr:hypothetical protein [Kiritimatiellia bacterium]